jgi:hypothetical protein
MTESVIQVVYMPFDSKTNPVSFGASPFPFLEDQVGGGKK